MNSQVPPNVFLENKNKSMKKFVNIVIYTLFKAKKEQQHTRQAGCKYAVSTRVLTVNRVIKNLMKDSCTGAYDLPEN